MKDRILKIIDFYKLNGAAFAVKVGIKDSQLSHIKSGRNEPSLDIVTKILENCPEISSEWLLFGSGDMVKNVREKTVTQPIKPQKEPVQLSIDGLFETNLSNDTNQRTEIETKTDSGNQNSITQNTSSTTITDSAKNSQSSVVNSKDNREIGISLTKQELLDLLTAVQLPKAVESSEKKDNPSKIEKTESSQSHRIKKIIVYYSDKSYEEFMPAQ